MKNLSTGTGLALLAGAIVAYPFASSLAPNANAVGVGTTAVTAVAAAATAQTEPAIVWYGTAGGNATNTDLAVVRAWSNGRVEMTHGYRRTDPGSGCRWVSNSCDSWIVISDPAQGLTFRSDINFDEKVDGADLGQLLADWGNAPRQDIPPSNCPLGLINP